MTLAIQRGRATAAPRATLRFARQDSNPRLPLSRAPRSRTETSWASTRRADQLRQSTMCGHEPASSSSFTYSIVSSFRCLGSNQDLQGQSLPCCQLHYSGSSVGAPGVEPDFPGGNAFTVRLVHRHHHSPNAKGRLVFTGRPCLVSYLSMSYAARAPG